MKALSIRAPWAYLIVHGIPIFDSVDNGDGTTSVEWNKKVVLKTVENRTWPLPRGFKVPQRIAVHVGIRVDHEAQLWLMKQGFAAMTVLMLYSRRLPCGALIGEVDIVDCIDICSDHPAVESPWYAGAPYFGFVLTNPAAYQDPIPYKGRLGFFEVNLP